VPRSGPHQGPLADDTGCDILHVDMDAFFASVEVRSRPELAGKPVIIGGIGPRGVVSSASYEARRYGVRSAMPMSRARRLCPAAAVIAPDMAGYAEASRAIMDIFATVTPLVEPLSLDEAFLDVRGARRRLGSPAAIAASIRATVSAQERLTCSVGIAPTKFVAKIGSTRCKPDGLLVIPVDGVLDFLHPLPVGALWGVGERTEEQLHRVGLRTIGDVARVPQTRLQRLVGTAASAHLSALAHGHDPRPVVPHEPDKSIGAEETFDTDVGDVRVLHRELLRLSAKTAARLRSSGQRGRTVSIKVRLPDFTTLSRSRTLGQATDSGQEIYAVARALFDAVDRAGAPIRLIGVRLEGIVQVAGTAEQLQLGTPENGWRQADQAVDAASARFGSDAIRPATLLADGPSTRSATPGRNTRWVARDAAVERPAGRPAGLE
jgi:DNA polymerase-4